MTREELLIQLEELAARMNIQIQYESPKSEDPSTFGGYCRLRDQPRIILHSKATLGRKIDLLTEALLRFDFGGLYMKPALRAHLDKAADSAADPYTATEETRRLFDP